MPEGYEGLGRRNPRSGPEFVEDAVGLALSGGGIRSAMFNLGVLQAFHASKLLPLVDYLATVSGGGYIGAYVSAKVVRPGGDPSKTDSTDRDEHEAKSPLVRNLNYEGANAGSRDQTSVPNEHQYLHDPKYSNIITKFNFLSRLSEMYARWLFGLLLNLLCLGSFVVLLCGAVAYAFRALDGTYWQDWSYWAKDSGSPWLATMLQFIKSSDLARAMIIPLAALTAAFYVAILQIWFLGAATVTCLALIVSGAMASSVRPYFGGILVVVGVVVGIAFRLFAWLCDESSRPFVLRGLWRRLLISWLILVLCSVAVMISNFDTVVTGGWVLQVREAPGGQYEEYVRIAALLQALVAIATFLVSQRFIKVGGTLGGNSIEKILRLLFTSAMSLVPLMVVYWVAREDFSGVAKSAVNARVLLARQQIMFGDGPGLAKEGRATAEDLVRLDQVTGGKSILEEVERRIRSRPLGRTTPISEIIQDTAQSYRDFYTVLPVDANARRYDAGLTSLGGRGQLRYEDVRTAVESLIGADYRYHIRDAKPGTSYEAEHRNHSLEKSAEPTAELNYVRSVLSYYDSPGATWWRLIDFDQAARGRFLLGTLVVFLISGCLINLNRTSMHDFYRGRLGEAFLADEHVDRRDLTMEELKTTAHGYPYHLVSATVNMPRHWADRGDESRNFTFGNLYCGSEVTGYRRTDAYSWSDLGKIKLADAMAISGAAISPAQSQTLISSFMLSLFNWRLGQWALNPQRRAYFFWRPMALVLLATSAIWWFRDQWFRLHNQKAKVDGGANEGGRRRLRAVEFWKSRPLLFLSDGAHYDNLGLELLLERRCRMIIVSDVSNDARFEMSDLLSVVRRARETEGIGFFACNDDGEADLDEPLEESLTRWVTAQSQPDRPPWWLARLFPHLKNRSFRSDPTTPVLPVFCGYIKYPDVEELATLFLIKPNYWGVDSWPIEVRKYFEANESFPHESNIDQFFTQRQAEAYRQLGFVTGLHLNPSPGSAPPFSRAAWPDVSAIARRMIAKVMDAKGKVEAKSAGA
nr:patatin-like phospholipase family protein [Planctomyces sp. SH-PL62]